ncbi:MAG: MBL fold metallo-hydrolase [Chloroflexi bacterium]|nr:MBL fold metallo-hydrolase [Chloroflexota bacterium]
MASLTFYGGVGEIGGNKILVQDNDTRIFLDFGMGFDRKGDFYEEFLQPRTNNGLKDLMELGIVPKLDGIYREDFLEIGGIEDVINEIAGSDSSLWMSDVKSYDEADKRGGNPFVQGILISHGHLDHFQFISLLDERIPVYCSSISKAIIEATEDIGKGGFESEFLSAGKRKIGKLGATAFFPGAYKIDTEDVIREYRILQQYQKIRNIEVRTFPVDHSVPGAVAFLIRTSDAKTIVYTGDMRFHGTRGDLTRKFQDSLKGSKPDALITEGTRIDEDTLDSEADVKQDCVKLISDAKGLAMVGFAWKDITRYQTMKEVAKETGRILVISPKLAYIISKLKGFADLGLKDVSAEDNVKVYLKRKGSMLYSKADYVKSKYDAGYSVI